MTGGLRTAEVDGYVSAQSGSPDRRPPPPIEGTSGTPLLDEQTLRTLSGHQVSAPHLYTPEVAASSGKPPSATSSDIQAEVRRQLHEVMLLRDEENAALRSRVELLASENQALRQEIAGQLYSSETALRSEGQGGFPGLSWFGRGIGSLMSGVSSPKPFSPSSRFLSFRPPPPPRPNHPSPGFEVPAPPQDVSVGMSEHQVPEGFRVQPPEPNQHSNPGGITTSKPVKRMLSFEPAFRESVVTPEVSTPVRPPEPPVAPDGPNSSTVGPDPLNVVLTGMAQLQGVVAGLAAAPKSIPKQETIKPGVNNLPELPSPGPEACLQFADWLHSSKPALSDVSDSSEEFWEMILRESGEWYTRHIKLDPITRLTDRPKPSEEVLNPRWARVSRRIETMVLAAAPSQVRDEISAARVTGLLAVISRLYVIYSPGGLGEREIGLRHIQDPSPGSGVRDTIDLLRRWRRWCDRMIELGGTVPDSALRVKALDRITRVVLQGHPDVAFRVNLMRASLQIDSTPSDHKVDQLHAQLLAELEALNHRSPPKEGDKAKDSNQGASAKVKGVEATESAGSPKNPKPAVHVLYEPERLQERS